MARRNSWRGTHKHYAGNSGSQTAHFSSLHAAWAAAGLTMFSSPVLCSRNRVSIRQCAWLCHGMYCSCQKIGTEWLMRNSLLQEEG